MKAKKVLALTLSAAMVLGLSACGDTQPTEAPAAEEKTEAPTAEEKKEEPAADTAAATEDTADAADTAAAPAELSY